MRLFFDKITPDKAPNYLKRQNYQLGVLSFQIVGDFEVFFATKPPIKPQSPHLYVYGTNDVQHICKYNKEAPTDTWTHFFSLFFLLLGVCRSHVMWTNGFYKHNQHGMNRNFYNIRTHNLEIKITFLFFYSIFLSAVPFLYFFTISFWLVLKILEL